VRRTCVRAERRKDRGLGVGGRLPMVQSRRLANISEILLKSDSDSLKPHFDTSFSQNFTCKHHRNFSQTSNSICILHMQAVFGRGGPH